MSVTCFQQDRSNGIWPLVVNNNSGQKLIENVSDVSVILVSSVNSMRPVREAQLKCRFYIVLYCDTYAELAHTCRHNTLPMCRLP